MVTILRSPSGTMPPERVRRAKVGDLLPMRLLHNGLDRRIESVAVLVPGSGELAGYLGTLDSAATDFASWDGRVVVLRADGQPEHRLVIVDRYGQVYETTDAQDAAGLPDAPALSEWFKFLATACPECGVLDDPSDRDWVP
jgi:hypothetical protein